jgi:hypothetical protein
MDYTLSRNTPNRKSITPTTPNKNAAAASTPNKKSIIPIITPTTPNKKANVPITLPINQPGTSKIHVGKIYTDVDIQELTSEGYIIVHPGLWDHLPCGAHIRYIKRDQGENKPKNERFRPGGFIRNHFITDDKKKLIIENKPGGKRNDAGYVSFPIAYDDIELLWKKYDRYSFVEIHLIHNSLAQKKYQIDELTNRVARLENILKNAIKK